MNILAQSAEKVVVDILAANDIPDPFYTMLKPERRKEFFNSYREQVNFMKHADVDHDGLLPVYDIVRLSDFAILGTIIRLLSLNEPLTGHMRAMLIFVGAQYPNVINIEASPHLAEAVQFQRNVNATRGDLAADLLAAIKSDPRCQQERLVDLADVMAAINCPL
jgi:hypothetical protein